ncbi:MAG: hypothetical protein R3B40_01455 [Polyangiales bacterium]
MNADDTTPDSPENSGRPDDDVAQDEREGEDDAASTSPSGARPGRKERVLHTRVPAVLESELKRLATSWRMPVSNVVRALLEDALDAVDSVGTRAEGELRGAAELLRNQRQSLRQRAHSEPAPAPEPSEAPRPPLEGAVGFTPMVLAHPTTCAVTGRAMPAGAQAFLVLFTEAGRSAIVSPEAVPQAG